jgi:hypothetical protein
MEPSDHEAIADRDDQHRKDKGEEEDADGKHGAPVVLGGRDLHQTLDLCRRETGSERLLEATVSLVRVEGLPTFILHLC